MVVFGAHQLSLTHRPSFAPPAFFSLRMQSNKWQVSTLTGDLRGAGTDANVSITLIGETSSSGPHKLENKAAGEFMEDLYHRGTDAWDTLFEVAKAALPKVDPGVAVDTYLGVDSNLVDDVCGYIIGSKIKPIGTDAPTLFSQSSGAPDWLYDNLDTLGIDSSKYRPKIYTVVVTVSKPLITASKSQAKSARQKGYDSVVFYGSDLVAGVPEVAVFSHSNVKIRKIEIV